MSNLSAYLRFNGNCRQAMNFYQECLGGELKIQSVGESPAASHMPPATHHQILHSTLANDSWTLMGSDMMDGERVNGNAMALTLNCSSEDEIKTCFAKLAEGGHVNSPLKTEFWGGAFGMLTDQYGIDWMLNYEQANR